MGFAAGFASGYEAVDKGRREEAARKKQIDDEAKKLKEEQDKVFNSAGQEIASHNKLVSDLTINMAKAEDETQYNTYASELKAANDNFTSLKAAKINNYKDTPLAASLDSLYSNARMSNAEQVVQTDIKDYNGKPVTVYLPESIANNKDSAILMENGKVGLAGDNNIGADGKITGYNPTNITPIKFKAPEVEDKKVFVAISPDGKKITDAFSDSEINSLQQKGFRFETSYKPKDTTIIRTGDNKPTAYSTVAVDSLPEAEQNILLDKGYKLTDKVTNETRSRLIGYDNKPEAKTTYGDVMIKSWKQAVEGGYDGSLAQYKAEEEARGAASGAAVKVDTTLTKAEEAKNKILGGKNIVDLESGSKEEKQLDNYFKLKVIENKKDLFSAKDKDILSAAPVLQENLKRMTSGKANDVSGFADNIISGIKTFTGVGVNVEDEAKIKSTMEQMGYSMARSMGGAGVLSNTDVKNGSKAVGSLWESDRALAGKLQGLVENSATNLRAIRNRDTTDKEAFDLYYGKTLKSFESLAEGLKNPKDKILSKDDILGVKPSNNNALPPLDINKFKK